MGASEQCEVGPVDGGIELAQAQQLGHRELGLDVAGYLGVPLTPALSREGRGEMFGVSREGRAGGFRRPSHQPVASRHPSSGRRGGA